MYTLQQLQQIKDNFALEIDLANVGKSKQLSYITHQIEPLCIPQASKLQVMVVGGTQFASAHYDLDVKQLREIVKASVPSLDTIESLVKLLAKYLDPNTTHLGLNFAFPLEPTFLNNKLDGILLDGAKEHKMSDMIGKPVAYTLETELQKKINKRITISVVNDTIGLLLAGLSQINQYSFASCIVGTGINAAIFDDRKAVNLQTGNFLNFSAPKTTKKISHRTNNKDQYLFEKSISGNYLYQHFNILSREQSLGLEIQSTEELNTLATVATDSPERELARSLFKMSAQLASCQIAGILEFLRKDLTFIMEGSVYWQGYCYQETVEKTVKQLTQYKAEYLKIPNSSLLGAAMLFC